MGSLPVPLPSRGGKSLPSLAMAGVGGIGLSRRLRLSPLWDRLLWSVARAALEVAEVPSGTHPPCPLLLLPCESLRTGLGHLLPRVGPQAVRDLTPPCPQCPPHVPGARPPPSDHLLFSPHPQEALLLVMLPAMCCVGSSPMHV